MSKQPPSSTQIARSERMQTSARTGAQALAETAARDIAVRKNMERLRALRLVKEAEEAALPKPVVAAKPRKSATGAKSTAKKSSKKAPGRLSDFIRAEKESGRRT